MFFATTVDFCELIFNKVRESIVGRVKVSNSPSVKGTKSSTEDPVVRERVPRITEMPPVIEPGTYGNHAPIGQA